MKTFLDYQKEIYQNKVDHNFNVTNVEKEFLLLYGEVAEAFDAYKKEQPVGDELADIAIYLFGLAEILHVDLGAEIDKKMLINKNRSYEKNKSGYAKRLE